MKSSNQAAGRKGIATPSLDRAQKAEHLRSSKAQGVSKLAKVFKKHQFFLRTPILKESEKDQRLMLRERKLIAASPPTVDVSRTCTGKKTRSEVQEFHQSRVEATDASAQARTEIDPHDSQVKIVHLGKYTTKIPTFPHVLTDLSTIIATLHLYPQVEVDMEAGVYGVLRIRSFKKGICDPDYKALAKTASARHRAAIRWQNRQQKA
ncbi:hypothetical protein C7974DRAFT_378570 [Boeremia exigua]|uniref:uncharacterized protein n=1 Tax=Boeremia exigua TaxID=749465 RepID=UPI001E8D39F6|nr:uncharacterized protein C7974DRAFT_378570 [Boeremia exigua]KAH6620545.1 hypothetical protein C7974DRAFT_378570 [Boeremia exigua]